VPWNFQTAESTMPMLMIKCPTTGEAVPTGIEVELDSFVQLPGIHSSLDCPACGAQHIWHPRDGWLAGHTTPHGEPGG
jgi:hypothetical protein